MDHEPIIQVVLGEAEPAAGILRFVLEGEGFHLVGQASTDDELLRVLASARPSVIVLDAGISAAAALEARQRAGCAAVVAVWPPGVAAVVAEERVDPDRVIDDLGHAVRRAATRPGAHEAYAQRWELVDLHGLDEPDDLADDLAEEPDERWVPQPVPARGPRTRRHSILAAAATFAIYATALSAIAATVPDTVARFDGARGGRPFPMVTETPDAPFGESAGDEPVDAAPEDGAGAPGDDRRDEAQGDRGQGNEGKGEPGDRGQGAGNSGQGQGNGGPHGNGGDGNRGQDRGDRGQGGHGQGQGNQGQGGGQGSQGGQGAGGQGGQGGGEGNPAQGGGRPPEEGRDDDRGRPGEPDDDPQEPLPEEDL